MALREPVLMWHPFKMMRRFDEELEGFRREMERSFFGPSIITRLRLFSLPEITFPETRFPEVKQMLMDVKDTGKEFVIDTEMPGISKENIDI